MTGEKTFRCREPDGRHVLRTAAEIVALNRSYYDTVARQWKKGDPSATGSNALTGNKRRWGGAISIPPPPPPTINWQSAPSLPSGSTDYMVPPGNYLNEDPSKPLFAPTSSRKYIVSGSRLKSKAEIVGRLNVDFGIRFAFFNSILETAPPTVDGKMAAKLIRGQGIRFLQIEGCTIPYAGGGIIMDGDAQSRFAGDAASGDGVFIRRSRIRGIDGRYSNGAGGYRKSSIALGHYNASATIRSSGGVVGWDIANFIQFLHMAGTPQDIADNEILHELGVAHEDILSYYKSSGGHPTILSYIRRNLIEVVSRYDWNSPRTPGSSYRHDGMVTGGWDGWQPTDLNTVKSSDTGIILGDSFQQAVEANNTAHLIVEENDVFGTRACLNTHMAQNCTVRNNRISPTDRHRSGVIYTGTQYSEFETVDYSGDANAGDTGLKIWRGNTFTGNRHRKNAPGVFGSYAADSDWAKNGGTGDPVTTEPRLTDGGAQLVTDWNAMQAAAGRTIGSTLA